jgi:hypothetical protein
MTDRPLWSVEAMLPRFAILNHAALDSGIPTESATQRIGITSSPASKRARAIRL